MILIHLWLIYWRSFFFSHYFPPQVCIFYFFSLNSWRNIILPGKICNASEILDWFLHTPEFVAFSKLIMSNFSKFIAIISLNHLLPQQNKNSWNRSIFPLQVWLPAKILKAKLFLLTFSSELLLNDLNDLCLGRVDFASNWINVSV